MENTLLTFKEHRLIYQNTPPESPGMWAALGKLGDAAGTLANSFASLVDTVTRGLSRGVDLLDVGIAKIEKGIAILSEKIQDPGQPQNLPEYREMPTFFANKPTPTGHEDLDRALMMQLRLIFLKYKGREYAEFLQPATDQFKLLESARNNIANRKRRYRPRIEELTRLIEDRETTVNSGNLLKTDPRRIDLETELAAYKSEKEHLQRESSYEAMWPKPLYQKTEFPPGSGEYIDRLIFDPKQKVRIDLNALYRVTGVYLSDYEGKLKEYEKEMERLYYHRTRIIEHADKSEPAWGLAKASFESQEAEFRRQGRAHETNVTNTKSKTQGNPTDVPILAGAIRRPASTAAPAPPRPTPTHSIQDDIDSLPY